MANEEFNILKILIEQKEEKFSIRKLSLLRKINYKSAYQAVMKLKEKGVINLERIGNTLSCSFNNKFESLVFSVEHERRQKILENKNIKVLYSRLNEINQSFVVLLFGSYVKGNKTKHSDIDLLIISEISKEIEQQISLVPLNIHPTFIDHKEFLEMAKSKEFNVVNEAIKNNLILIGIEDYYRLLENVKRITG